MTNLMFFCSAAQNCYNIRSLQLIALRLFMKELTSEEKQDLMACFNAGLLDEEDPRITDEDRKNYIPIWDRIFNIAAGDENE